jgi:DNA-binding transcriptional LysR family regulator
MLTQQVDLAVLISDRRLLRNVRLSPLGIEPLMLAGPATSRLDPTKPVGIETMSGLPFLFYRPPNHLRLLIETALRRRGLVFHVKVELETLPLMLELIERGAGYTVLPPSTIVGRGARIKRRFEDFLSRGHWVSTAIARIGRQSVFWKRSSGNRPTP